MEFIRVNENMVKCIISEEDMDLYDVSIEDFFTRSENALEFLHEIVKQASEEVGYKPQGPLTSLQITPMDDHGFAIFLTEKPQFDLHSMFKGLMKDANINIPEDILKKLENATDEERLEYNGKFLQNVREEIEKNILQSIKKETNVGADGSRHFVSLERKIFVFENASDLLRYASVVEYPVDIESSLYKDPDHGVYYLIVDRNEADVEALAGVYLTAYEYGHFVSEKPEQATFIREHCECLIAENAIGKMKGEKRK